MTAGAVLASMMNGDWGAGWAVVIVVMVMMMGGVGWMMWSMMRSGNHGRDQPLDPRKELAWRYAGGDLTSDEYQERLRVLEDTQG